jgi:hypothetical protein
VNAAVINQYIVHFQVGCFALFLVTEFYKSVLEAVPCTGERMRMGMGMREHEHEHENENESE